MTDDSTHSPAGVRSGVRRLFRLPMHTPERVAAECERTVLL